MDYPEYALLLAVGVVTHFGVYIIIAASRVSLVYNQLKNRIKDIT